MPKSKTIIVTGFEPFGGYDYNPSEQIAIQLDGSQVGNFVVKSLVLPVDTNIVPRRLAQIVTEYQPVALVLLGLAFGRDGISLERIAVNLKDWQFQDNAGNLKTDEPIDVTGPTAYLATLPIRQIKAALDVAHIPAHISNTAGLYLCNQVMYSGLHLAATQALEMLCGFIHLPATPELTQATGKPAAPALLLETQKQAVQIALHTLTLLL